MFINFSAKKIHYEKGQIFPFLIAVLVVVIVMVMITVNLGQIGVFKTDVSNAADAGALAGASSLSGALLGFGMTSDNMAGFGITTTAAVILLLLGVITAIAGILIWIAGFIKQMATYYMALGNGRMAWSSAKKTALQYAFQNAGVDEPRSSFEDFLRKVYGLVPNALSPEETTKKYKIYLDGDDALADDYTRRKIKTYSQSGFSRFMENENKKGYWNEGAFGAIDPGVTAPVIVTSGYGWSQKVENGQLSNFNSFDSGDSYYSHQNYVEVKVTGTIMYPLEIYTMGDMVLGSIRNAIKDFFDKNLPWWLSWIGTIIAWKLDYVMVTLFVLPAGLKMDTQANTTNSPIRVEVARFKRNSNLGLWNFRYGKDGKVSAAATAHAYPERALITISPSSDILDLTKLLGNPSSLFDTTRHLFETKLISTF